MAANKRKRTTSPFANQPITKRRLLSNGDIGKNEPSLTSNGRPIEQLLESESVGSTGIARPDHRTEACQDIICSSPSGALVLSRGQDDDCQSSRESDSARALIPWRPVPEEASSDDEAKSCGTVQYPRRITVRVPFLVHAFTKSNRRVLTWLELRPKSSQDARSLSSLSWLSASSSITRTPDCFSMSVLERALMSIRDFVDIEHDRLIYALEDYDDGV